MDELSSLEVGEVALLVKSVVVEREDEGNGSLNKRERITESGLVLNLFGHELLDELDLGNEVLLLGFEDDEHVDGNELVGCELDEVLLDLNALPEVLHIVLDALSHSQHDQQLLKR